MVAFCPELSVDDVSFTLIEAPGRNLPEVGDKPGACVVLAAAEPAEPSAFVVGTDGVLRPAPRRSGHVACPGGATVLGAGEISFVHEAALWAVSEVGNRSSGYCPLQPCGTADVTRRVHARSKD